jgi:hypothetical protein
MNIEDQVLEAQTLLDWYIRGSSAEGVESQIPDTREPGIRLRSPALVDIRPEYGQLPNDDAGRSFEANEGPEPSDESYELIDRCPLHLAKVEADGDALLVKFVFVVQFDVDDALPGEDDRTVRVMLPFSAGTGQLVVEECIDMLEEYLGADDEFLPKFTPVVLKFTAKEFGTLAAGDI